MRLTWKKGKWRAARPDIGGAHAFIPEILTEHLLHARQCSTCWKDSCVQGRKKSCSHGLYILVGRRDNKQLQRAMRAVQQQNSGNREQLTEGRKRWGATARQVTRRVRAGGKDEVHALREEAVLLVQSTVKS